MSHSVFVAIRCHFHGIIMTDWLCHADSFKLCQLSNVARKQTGHISMTTDLWTSAANHGYLSITLHFIDDSFQMHNICAYVPLISQFHSGENISNLLKVN